MKKLFLLTLLFLLILPINAQQKTKTSSQSTTVPKGYVDLGLPSGTLWKGKNEKKDMCTCEKAVAAYGNFLPTQEHFGELATECKWIREDKGYKIVGPNGNSIFLPYIFCDKKNKNGSMGIYWTLRSCNCFYFTGDYDKCMGQYTNGYVRLVQGQILSDSTYIEQLIAETLERGAGADSIYRLENTMNKFIYTEDVRRHLRDKSLYIVDGQTKIIQGITMLDWLTFMSEENYDDRNRQLALEKKRQDQLQKKREFFESYTNHYNVKYDQLKPGGIFFSKVNVSKNSKGVPIYKAKRYENVYWSGDIVDSLMNGKGAGIILENGVYGFFEGEFENGFPVGKIEIKFRNANTRIVKGFGKGFVDRYKDMVLDKYGGKLSIPALEYLVEVTGDKVSWGGTGTFFYVKGYNGGLYFDMEQVDNVQWNGYVYNGLLDGKGTGKYIQGGYERSFEGEFYRGILLLPSVKIIGKDYRGVTREWDIVEMSNQCHDIKQVIMRTDMQGYLYSIAKGYFITHFYKDYAAAVNDAYESALAINTANFQTIFCQNVSSDNRQKEYNSGNNKVDTRTHEYDEWGYKLSGNQNIVTTVPRLSNKYLNPIAKLYIGENVDPVTKQYRGEDDDPLNMIPKAKELLELYYVMDMYEDLHRVGYGHGYGGFFYAQDVFLKEDVLKNRDRYFETLDIVKKNSKSSESSFKAFYSKIYPRFIKEENYYKNEYVNAEYTAYRRELEAKRKDNCENCKIKEVTDPRGYVPQDGKKPAHSEHWGYVRMKNGKNVAWEYVWPEKEAQKIRIVTGDLITTKYYYTSKEELIDDCINGCIKRYCQ